MKKFFTALLALVMVLSLAACGNGDKSNDGSYTPSTGANDSSYDPNAAQDFEMQTSSENPVVTIGTIDSSLYATPVLVTSFGQSTDASMLDTVMKRAGVEYVYDSVATAATVANYKTVIIAVGASSKGLGAAGVSESEETERAKEIIQTIQNNDIEVICCHIGGSSRRGSLSDEYADMVMAECSYIVLKEDANFDYKFTEYAETNSIPITLINSTKDTVSVFTDLFS